MNPIPDYPANQPIPMLASRQWPAAVHRLGAPAVAALRAAEATNRPLLIRGLPGVGKSMTARAAAVHARRPLLARVIDSRTEADDLKARFDTVRRLADAQVQRAKTDPLPDDEHYVEPQVLWWAFDWDGAAGAGSDGETLHKISTEVPDGWTPAQRSVLLLDEIDKADPELPNALLEAFGANGFAVPVTGETVWCPPERRPLIVLTTNEERELPSAFLRRCLVLWLALPADIDELIDEFIAIGHEHQEHLVDLGLRKGRCLVIDEAAKVVAEGRRAHAESSYQPGTSEFLDLVAALAELYPDQRDEQTRGLADLQQFVLRKAADALR